MLTKNMKVCFEKLPLWFKIILKEDWCPTQNSQTLPFFERSARLQEIFRELPFWLVSKFVLILYSCFTLDRIGWFVWPVSGDIKPMIPLQNTNKVFITFQVTYWSLWFLFLVCSFCWHVAAVFIANVAELRVATKKKKELNNEEAPWNQNMRLESRNDKRDLIS